MSRKASPATVKSKAQQIGFKGGRSGTTPETFKKGRTPGSGPLADPFTPGAERSRIARERNVAAFKPKQGEKPRMSQKEIAGRSTSERQRQAAGAPYGTAVPMNPVRARARALKGKGTITGPIAQHSFV